MHKVFLDDKQIGVFDGTRMMLYLPEVPATTVQDILKGRVSLGVSPPSCPSLHRIESYSCSFRKDDALILEDVVLSPTSEEKIMSKRNRFLDNLGTHIDAILRDATDALDTVFENFDADVQNAMSASPQCGYRVTKGKNLVTIECNVAGVTNKDVEVTLTHGIIKVVFTNFLKQRVTHSFKVSPSTDSSDISAKVADGLLTITVKGDDVPAPKTGNIPVT